MGNERFKLTVDVHLILRKQDKILLLKRQNTGYEDGSYHLPAGHMDGNETVTSALIRESKEEVGIEVDESNLHLVQIMHSMSNSERMGFFFEVQKWRGEVSNMEPDKCSELAWFNINDLPKPMVPYAFYALTCYKNNQLLSKYGWDQPQ